MEPLNNKDSHWTATACAEADSTKREPGHRIGPYLLIASLDIAGDAWKAYDTRLSRNVAIRFGGEYRNGPAIDHPHVCAIIETGPDYIVTEFVDGSPIAGPLPLALALKFAGQILDALDSAHRQGIFHCDLKPSNIIVTGQGIKLCEFAQSEPCQDARMDIFMFGCVLYSMLTGITPADLFDRPLPTLDGIAPPALATIVLQCLEKGPDRRWKTVAHLKTAIAVLN